MKITKQIYNKIKHYLEKHSNGSAAYHYDLSISTINKIKRSNSYEEYKSIKKEINKKGIRIIQTKGYPLIARIDCPKDVLYLVNESNFRYVKPEPKLTLLSVIKKLLHLK